MTKHYCYCALILVVTALSGLAQTNQVTDKKFQAIKSQISERVQVLNTNKTVKSLRSLKESSDLLAYTFPDEIGGRTNFVKLWLVMAAALDRQIDLQFKPSESTSLNWKVIPPRDGENGVQYPAGIDPMTLKNSVARSNYLSAIEDNKNKIQEANFQGQLRIQNDEMNQVFSRFLRSNYSNSDADQNELSDMLKAVNLLADRKQIIEEQIKHLPRIPTGDFPFPK